MTEQQERGGASRPSDGYTVGYCRPPAKHQFRQGEPSRNPAGRRGKRRPVTPPSELPDFLDGQVTVGVAGKPTLMTRDEAIDHALFQEAIKGNVQASRRLDERRAERERRQQAARSSSTNPFAAVSAEDEALIAEALQRRSHASAATAGTAMGGGVSGRGDHDALELDETPRANEGAEQQRGPGHV
jgi:hypothetical protein